MIAPETIKTASLRGFCMEMCLLDEDMGLDKTASVKVISKGNNFGDIAAEFDKQISLCMLPVRREFK